MSSPWSSTGLGLVDPAHLVRRKGSREGDLICVTGVLGRAQAAIEGHTRYNKALFEPQPRVAEGQILGRSGATSMMDISDGLALSLYDLTLANRCGYRITSAMIPVIEDIPYQEGPGVRRLRRRGLRAPSSPSPANRLPLEGVTYHVVGHVIGETGAFLNDMPLERRGYQHRWQ